MPMTSPVDFISGPRSVSTPANLLNGSTDSLTETCVGTISSVKPSSSSLRPTITRDRQLGQGHADGLADEGYGPRRPGVHLEGCRPLPP